MCLLITGSRLLSEPILAFVLRYTSYESDEVLSIMTQTPLAKSLKMPGYFEDPNWDEHNNFKVGATITKGIFHCIIDGLSAANSLLHDGWSKKFISPRGGIYFNLGLFLAEIPPQQPVYTGISIDCSGSLDFTLGLGVRYYKIIIKLQPGQMHRLQSGGFYYYNSLNPVFKNRVLIQLPGGDYVKFISIKGLEKDQSLEAGQILSQVLYSSKEFYSRFNKMYNKEQET